MTCFATGTLITTLTGEKPVEALQPGDRVITRDSGLQTVRGIQRRDLDYGRLASQPHLTPVLVSIGAMGPALPERDVLLSPGARLVVGEDRVPFGAGQAEALVPVVDMTDGRAIRRCRVLGVCYVHVGLDKHEVILANGIWVEAFQPHDQSDSGHEDQIAEMQVLFPGVDAQLADSDPALTC